MPFMARRTDQVSNTTYSKVKYHKNKRKLDYKKAVPFSTDGINPPSIEMVWQEVEQYMRPIENSDLEVLQKLVEEARNVVGQNLNLLHKRGREEYFSNLLEDIGVDTATKENGDGKENFLRIKRRGRFYDDLWNEKIFLEKLQSENPGVYDHIQACDDWKALYPGYDDDLFNDFIEKAEDQIDSAYRAAAKKSKLRISSSSQSRQFSITNAEQFTVPHVPVEQWHPANWGNYQRPIHSDEGKIDCHVIHPAAYKGRVPPRWVAVRSPETSALYGDQIEQDEITDEIRCISAKYVPLCAINSRRVRALYDIAESEAGVQNIFKEERELNELCEQYYKALYPDIESVESDSCEDSVNSIRLNASKEDLIALSGRKVTPEAANIAMQATAFAMNLSIGDSVDVFDNTGNWSHGIIKDTYMQGDSHHRFLKVHLSDWGDECDFWVNVCSMRLFPHGSMTVYHHRLWIVNPNL